MLLNHFFIIYSMLPFYKEADIHKSKMELIADFEAACDQRIYKKSSRDNLMITSYNVHFFSPPIDDKKLDENVQLGVDRILKFCEKTRSDIVLVQEALFDPNIISIFKNAGYIPYVCNTYKIGQYYFGNIILIRDHIIIRKFSRELYISGYKDHKKCIVNVVIEYHNTTISIYNIHLDVWDRTGKCRLEQINKLLEKVKMDKAQNILIGGDFNAIKESDYSEDERAALKKFYSTFTKDPFKEIEFLMGKGFRDCANRYITPTVWTKQRVDFFFVNRGFTLDVSNYSTHTISGSDHFPISIEIGIKKTNYQLIDTDKKLVFKITPDTETAVILKILPIWNKYWKDAEELLYEIGLTKSQIIYGKKNAMNEYIITKYLAKLVSNNISYSFVPLISAKKVDILPKDIQAVIPELDKIPNQKYYFLTQPKLLECSFINRKNKDLIVFQLQWGLFIAYKLFGFIHGDILHGVIHNLLCYKYKLPGKNSLIVRYKQNIWRFPIIGEELPVIVLFDYGFSNFDYKNIHIYSKIPLVPMEESTAEKKWELDIQGYNVFLKKIGIKRKIPKIPLKDYEKLLDRFETYKISLADFRKIDKAKYLLFDGNTKKI
jgi:endonuclease/exonuclease/phosphatase family metal-dependent hydrolase